MSDADILAAFRQFDTDGNGFIDRDELATVLQDLDPDTWTRRRLQALLNCADQDKNGFLDYTEFCDWIAATGPDTDLMKVGKGASVTFMLTSVGGETFQVDAAGCETIAELKQKAAEVMGTSANQFLKLLKGTALLRDGDPLSSLRTKNLFVVTEEPFQAYRCDTGGGVIKLVSEGDDDYDEELSKKAQVRIDAFVPPPTGEYPNAVNLASESMGANVEVSSCIWGAGSVADEKKLNMIRLGSLQGDPRYVGGDNSFIFREGDREQVCTLELGQVATLVRVGTMCYGDRWLNCLAIETRDEDVDEWVSWGSVRKSWRRGGAPYYDREPTRAKWIRFSVSSGHYYGAGARLGPLFAYGWSDAVEAAEGPTNEPTNEMMTNEPTNEAFTNEN